VNPTPEETGVSLYIPPAETSGGATSIFDPATFKHLMEVATTYSNSSLIPERYRKHPEDCLIALQMSQRLGVDLMMLMQNTYVVHGRPGMEGKLVIALINSRGPFDGGVSFEYTGSGDTRSCKAYGTHKKSGKVCEQVVDVRMAKQMGWWGKDGSAWPKMTDLMLSYRSATFLARLYCPEVMMGMNTVDELRDIGPRDITPQVERADATPAPQAEGMGESLRTRAAELQRKQKPQDPATMAPRQKPDAVEVPSSAKPEPVTAAEPAPASQPQEPPLVFPPLPESLKAAINADKHSPLVQANRAIEDAFFSLPGNSMALKELWDARGKNWGTQCSESEIKTLTQLKNVVWRAAAGQGYSQL